MSTSYLTWLLFTISNKNTQQELIREYHDISWTVRGQEETIKIKAKIYMEEHGQNDEIIYK